MLCLVLLMHSLMFACDAGLNSRAIMAAPRAESKQNICAIVSSAAAAATSMDVDKALIACASVSPSILSSGNVDSVLIKSDKLLRMCANDDADHREYEKVALLTADEVKYLVEHEIGKPFTFALDGRWKYSYGER